MKPSTKPGIPFLNQGSGGSLHVVPLSKVDYSGSIVADSSLKSTSVLPVIAMGGKRQRSFCFLPPSENSASGVGIRLLGGRRSSALKADFACVDGRPAIAHYSFY